MPGTLSLRLVGVIALAAFVGAFYVSARRGDAEGGHASAAAAVPSGVFQGPTPAPPRLSAVAPVPALRVVHHHAAPARKVSAPPPAPPAPTPTPAPTAAPAPVAAPVVPRPQATPPPPSYVGQGFDSRG